MSTEQQGEQERQNHGQGEAPNKPSSWRKADWRAVGHGLLNILLVSLAAQLLYLLAEQTSRAGKPVDQTLAGAAIFVLSPVLGILFLIAFPGRNALLYADFAGLSMVIVTLLSMFVCFVHFVGRKGWVWWKGFAMALLVAWCWGVVFAMDTSIMNGSVHRVSAFINDLRYIQAANYTQYSREEPLLYQLADPMTALDVHKSRPSRGLIRRICLIAPEGESFLIGGEMTDNLYKDTSSGYLIELRTSPLQLKGPDGTPYKKGIRAVFSVSSP